MPKAVTAVNDANSERLRMLEEDAEEEDGSVHTSVDRFRESRKSIVSRRTSRSLHSNAVTSSSSFSKLPIL